jgi:hypothetical protein
MRPTGLRYTKGGKHKSLAYHVQSPGAEELSTGKVIMRRSAPLLALTLSALLLGACTRVVYQHPSGGDEPTVVTSTSRPALKIPPGHLPQPGACRIWYPGVPPGKQPPPGDCQALARNVPEGAWLISRYPSEPRQVEVTVYDDRRPGVVIEVRLFNASTGAFLGLRAESASR